MSARLPGISTRVALDTRMAPETLVSGIGAAWNLALVSGLSQAVGMAKKRTKADRLQRQTEQLEKRADRHREKAIDTRAEVGRAYRPDPD